eukprot:3386763-Rhodomonas_salina.1
MGLCAWYALSSTDERRTGLPDGQGIPSSFQPVPSHASSEEVGPTCAFLLRACCRIRDADLPARA